MPITIFPTTNDRLNARSARARRALAILLGVLVTGLAHADVTDTFTANFDVHRGKLALGTTAFGITPGAKAGCYVYTGQARPNALVRLFLGDVTDESRFCIEDGVIRPQHFSHHIAGDEKKSYTLDFDWAAHEVHYRSEAGKQDTMTLPERALDPLSIHMAARQWVDAADNPETLGEADFPMVDEDEIKTYRLRATDGGDIETPAGRYDTVRVDRIDDNKRLTFWLARSAEWIPVRVEQQKDDDGIFQMNMTSLKR